MKEQLNTEKIKRLTAEEFQNYCELLENNAPSLERYYPVVLLAENQPQFYGIADCDRHEDARHRAVEEYRRTSPQATVPKCIVFGRCNEPGCDCGHQLREAIYPPLMTVSVILCRHFDKLCEDVRRRIPVFLDTKHLIENAEILETPEGDRFHLPDDRRALKALLQAGYTIIAIIPETGTPVYFPFGDGHELAVAAGVLAQVLNREHTSQS